MLLKNEWITKEIKQEFKEYLETNENEITMRKSLSQKNKIRIKVHLQTHSSSKSIIYEHQCSKNKNSSVINLKQ